MKCIKYYLKKNVLGGKKMTENERILREGTIVRATKLQVITIILGRATDFEELEGTVMRNKNGNIYFYSKDSYTKCPSIEYSYVAVRIIGDQVKTDGLYDFYFPEEEELKNLRKNRIKLGMLTDDQINELVPLLKVAPEISLCLTVAEKGCEVVVIDEQMVGENGYIKCLCLDEDDPDGMLRRFYPGDVFVVVDRINCQGYRLSRKEFSDAYKLEDN